MWACVDDAAKKNAEWRELPMRSWNPPRSSRPPCATSAPSRRPSARCRRTRCCRCCARRVDTFRALLPCVVALRNPNLKPAHYDKLDAALGRQMPRGEALTWPRLLELNLHSHGQLVAKMASDATQEAALHDMIDKVREQWKVTEFATKPFKDSKDATVLGAVDDVIADARGDTAGHADGLGSPYVTALRAEAEGLAQEARALLGDARRVARVQRAWMYLESIFKAADIQRQLPNELQDVPPGRQAVEEDHDAQVEADPDALRNATQPNSSTTCEQGQRDARTARRSASRTTSRRSAPPSRASSSSRTTSCSRSSPRRATRRRCSRT